VAEPAFRTPQPVAGLDIRSLPLSPREAFLLSRIDGFMTEADLSALTGLDAATVGESLERLVKLGAIEMVGPTGADARVSQPQIVSREPPSGEVPRVSQTHLRAPISARDMDEPVDLDAEKKRRVLELHPLLSQLDYYALLGVAENADRKEIKRAYYGVAPNYHPDKFYGKNLGSFKAKMEAIFAQLTLAYETLTSSERRAEYDGYLSNQKQTRSMEALLRGVASAEIEAEIILEPSVPPAPRVTDAPPASAPPTEHVPTLTSPPSSRSKEVDRARREALARKLGVARTSTPPMSSGRISIPAESRLSAPPTSQSSIQAAAEELKRRHAAIASESRRSQARRYVEAANAALPTNPAAAANALRLALTIDPENPEIEIAHREAARLAAVALADGYLKQGDYESRNGQWVEAARSYTKAAAGMPDDALVMQKAAYAMLKSSGDMHKAADYAKKSLALAPSRIDARLVLVEVYIAAGLPLAAKREIEQARQIAPQDGRITELSKRLK
jgi:curved DNA-binding protein CbpA